MSCLVSKFKYYLDLTDDEQEMLSVLERDTKTFKNESMYLIKVQRHRMSM